MTVVRLMSPQVIGRVAGIVRGRWTDKFRGVMASITHGYEDW